MNFVIVVITALISFASLPAVAQSGRTFYIDSSSGSNSNPGTQAAPWKTHPYMQTGVSCTGTGRAPTYTHQAGDQFIFKGGATWPAACFSMEIALGGSSNSVRDIYTVDVTWFNGGSFTKPIFSGSGASLNHMIGVNASNVTLSTLDIGRNTISNNANGCTGTINVPANIQNVTATLVFLHDWLLTTATDMSGHAIGGMCSSTFITQADNNIVLDHSEVRDDGNIVGGVSTPVGVCGKNIHIAFTHCHLLVEGIVGHGAVHDSEFDHITWAGLSLDNGGAHGNIVEADTFNGDGPIYNNSFHNNQEGVNLFETTNSNIYNNVFYDSLHNSQIIVGITSTDNGAGTISNIYNNTFKCDLSDDFRAVRIFNQGGGNLGTLNMKNNVFIACTIDTAATNTVNSSNNVTLTLAQMTSQGLSTANNLAPNSSSTLLISQGTYLTSICSGNDSSDYSFALLCKDIVAVGRPSSSAWDLGAYEFSGQSSSQTSSKPNSPGNLFANIQ